MKTKILFVNGFSGGSTWNIINDIALSLPKDEFELFFVGREKGNKLNFSECFYISSSRFMYYLNRIQTFIFGNDSFIKGISNLRLNFILNKIKPNIIHLHNTHSSFCNVETIFKYAAKHKTRLIWTLHDFWICSGRCCSPIDCFGYKNGCPKCEYKNYYPSTISNNSATFSKKKKNLLNTYSQILTLVAPSRWLYKLVKEIHPGCNCVLIGNGVNSEIFKPSSSSLYLTIPREKTIIGCAAYNLNEAKGYFDIVHLNSLLDRDRFQIVTIGSNLKTQNCEDGIIRFPRIQSKEEMAAFYNSIDIFFNPTKQDNFPTTHLESLSCGTPIITYNVGGAGELIQNGTNGFVIDKNDVNAVAEILDHYDFKKMKRNIRDKYSFSKEEMICSYYKLFTDNKENGNL